MLGLSGSLFFSNNQRPPGTGTGGGLRRLVLFSISGHAGELLRSAGFAVWTRHKYNLSYNCTLDLRIEPALRFNLSTGLNGMWAMGGFALLHLAVCD